MTACDFTPLAVDSSDCRFRVGVNCGCIGLNSTTVSVSINVCPPVDGSRRTMADHNTTTVDGTEYETTPAEDEDGFRHDDLEVGSEVIYEGEQYTVARIGRSAIRLEGDDGEIGVRDGGIELIVNDD